MDVLQSKCRFDREILQKYIDNTIEPLEFIFLKEHLKVCAECKDELDFLKAVDSSLISYFNQNDYSEEVEKKVASLIGKLIEERIHQAGGKRKILNRLSKSFENGRGIANSAICFINYIPGNKTIKKRAGSIKNTARDFVKTYLNEKLNKLISVISS